MTSRPIPQCLSCKHWISPDQIEARPEDPIVQTCTAFPVEIPDQITLNRADHRKPSPGDHGIRWEPLDGAEFPDWALDAGHARR